MKDGRIPYSDLVKKLNISKPTISRRIASLVNNGFIKIAAIPNVNLDVTNAFILLNADYDKIDDICKKLYNHHETHLFIRLINEYEILITLTMNSNSLEELHDFIKNTIACIEGVLKIETFLVENYTYINPDILYKLRWGDLDIQ